MTTLPGCAATTSPMTAASLPYLCFFIAVRTAAVSGAGTTATSLPSLAIYSGSRPSSSQAASTARLTGTLSSWMTMPARDFSAKSLRVVARPPRVGSRRQRIFREAASMSAASPWRGAQSEGTGKSNLSPSRRLKTAMPWSPIVPLTITLSPGQALAAEMLTPSGTRPTPAVLMKSLSAPPWLTTLVSPVTIFTFASAAAFLMEMIIFFSSATGRPSSMMRDRLK